MKSVTFILLILLATTAVAQQTIFSVMQGPARLGDVEFEKGEYKKAIEYYQVAIGKDRDNTKLLSRMAQCYYQLKDFKKSIETFEVILKKGKSLTQTEIFDYAEAQTAMGNYAVALSHYKQFLEHDRDNEFVSKKVWALSNIAFIHEDSAHFRVKMLEVVNTKASEMGPVLFSNGLVFTSNRKGTRPVDMATHEDAGMFYELYLTTWKIDSLSKNKVLTKPSRFAKSLDLPYNAGPVAFFSNETQMVFVASSPKSNDEGARPLGLYFAKLEDSKWKITSAWQHNGELYSISDITINEEGTQLYFSSNMKGGSGGKDIYSSMLQNGTWSRPVNLGETINTRGDEVFPYLHRNGTLYFSSDGLPGIGGLDIFQSIIKQNGYSEPENIGYPINSRGDDFGLTFDSLATHGFFASNRLNGGLDDDIYEFEMDLQTYPFQLSGVLKFKEHMSSDSIDIHPWANVKMTLVDTWQNIALTESVSGEDGSFKIRVPYFSRYHIVVTDEKGNEHKASLELEKFRTESIQYEIVVVKELIAELKEQKNK